MASYSPAKFTSVNIKTKGANLVNNNLAAAHERLVYAHSKAASSLTYGGQESERIFSKVDTKDISYVHGITVCHSPAGSAIVITTVAGLQIWNSTGVQMLLNYMHNARPKDDGERTVSWSLGCAAATECSVDGSNRAFITAGSSFGELLLFSFEPATGHAKFLKTEAAQVAAVTALGSALDSSRGATSSDTLVSGGGDGGLSVWRVSPNYEKVCSSKPNSHGPVAGLAVRNNQVIAAFTSGVIQILSQDSLQLQVEIFGHSRMLSSLSMHPTRDVFATAAQDSTLNVWKLPAAGTAEVGPLLSVCWEAVVITGVAFCGKSFDDVAAIGYDNEELRIYTAN